MWVEILAGAYTNLLAVWRHGLIRQESQPVHISSNNRRGNRRGCLIPREPGLNPGLSSQ
jgi:hypothetical protein